MFFDRVSTEVFEDFSPISEVESVGWDFGVCVFAVLPSVLVVSVPFSNVNVVCDVGFCDSDCEFVEPQTFSLSRKRKVCFVECRECMNIDATPVTAPPATSSKTTPPTPQQSPPPPPGGTPLHILANVARLAAGSTIGRNVDGSGGSGMLQSRSRIRRRISDSTRQSSSGETWSGTCTGVKA